MNKKKMMESFKNRKQITIVISTGLIFFASIYILAGRKPSKPERTPPSVSIIKVMEKKDIKKLNAIGIVKAAQGIEVSATSSGIIQSIDFVSGQNVLADSVLLTLKNDDLKAILMEEKVKYRLAISNSHRSQKLVNNGYVSRQDADLTDSNVEQAKARLEHSEALLGNTIIKAPFAGNLGISKVSLGQYISAGQVIVSLQDNSKMYVEFSIPEKNSDLITVDEKIIVCSNQASQHQWQGKNIALGSQLDENTRSLPVRAELFPPYKSLIPGMFVNVTLLLPDAENKPAIPQSAIVYNPYGNFVYQYYKGVVVQRYVDIGQKIGKNIIIEKGLRVGEEVVFEGQQKLYNGAKVQIIG